MRILLSVDPEIPVPPKLYGGIERIVDGLVGELRRRNHEVGLIAHEDSTCPVDYFMAWPKKESAGVWKSARNAISLIDSVRTFHPDVLHSFSRLGYLLPLFPSRLPLIMSYQRHTGGKQNSIAARLGGRHFAFTACSEYIAGMGRPWGGQWSAIHNFVDTEFYKFTPQVAVDAPLVFLSRIERIKGVHAAIAIARRAGRPLIIAGNRVEQGDGATYWEREIAPHLGQNGIEYIGPVNDEQKNELLGRAAAMLVPIEWGEPFGIVFAEALACGTPVIASPLGALPEIVENGVHGFLINSIDEGVQAVGQIDALSRQLCRQRAEQFFSRKFIVSQYESLYRDLLELSR